MFLQPISKAIISDKYLDKDHNELSLLDVRKRIIENIVILEEKYHKKLTDPNYFDDLLDNFWPGGRITANLGSKKTRVCLVNCIGSESFKDDSMIGIMNNLTDIAILLQYGGGVGQDWSGVRHRGAWIRGVGGRASGPISFMDVGSASCKAIRSAGGRRGAQIGVLDVRHPDVFDMITCKDQRGKLSQYNISIGITEGFIQAVRDDADWDLRFPVESTDPKDIVKTVKAKDIWDKLILHAYKHNEPGVLFLDNANYYNNLWALERITLSNP